MGRHRRIRAALLASGAAAICAGALPATAVAGDRALLRAHGALYPRMEHAAARAAGPEGVQAMYDAARDLQEAARRAGRPGGACAPLARALARAAASRVLQAEGVDRPSPGDVRAGRRAAARAGAGLAAQARACAARPARSRAAVAPAMAPGDGEAFFGQVVARAPRGADRARLLIDGRPAGEAPVRGGRARLTAAAAPGRHDLVVVVGRGGRDVATARARGAWLLPASARAAAPGDRIDPALAGRLRAALARGPRHRAAWAQDLRTGAAAGVGADAPYPAASTVKLGLMAGALARLGGGAGRGPFAHDLRAMTTWSSNLATNRILRRLGGTATAARGLRALGARASTFPGEYIVGTQLQPALPAGGAGGGPPAVSRRVTTARDLARMLHALHAAAVGAPGARARTGLTARAARLALGWLLASQQRAGNRSLLAGGAPAGTLVAQKNGWIRSARHAAGILYTPRGPVIAVVLAYDAAGVPFAAGRALGARVAAAASQ
ncbi:serine hydrolase [Miltoncostaea marina]|uniref:serine hydrolase n=1 Tax=Miltoncostaea marina TaxID=2843215 RepID=UPI001C3DABAF|nr:serine hydrolase [Miltoncostaea marina]